MVSVKQSGLSKLWTGLRENNRLLQRTECSLCAV